MASRQGFGELKTEQLGGHSQEQQRHRQAPIDDDGVRIPDKCDTASIEAVCRKVPLAEFAVWKIGTRRTQAACRSRNTAVGTRTVISELGRVAVIMTIVYKIQQEVKVI